MHAIFYVKISLFNKKSPVTSGVIDVKVATQIFDTKIEKKRAKWYMTYIAAIVKTILTSNTQQWYSFAMKPISVSAMDDISLGWASWWACNAVTEILDSMIYD